MKRFMLIVAICGLASPLLAQFDLSREIIILHSTKDYNAALKTAKLASQKLNQKLDLHGYKPNKESGLSLTKAGCEDAAYEFPCYVARGNGYDEESDYVSIEYSTGYEGFAAGYYIVVFAIGEPKSPQMVNSLSTAKKVFKDAYGKRTRVWRGCMH